MPATRRPKSSRTAKAKSALTAKTKSSREKVSDYRARMRAKGLRLIQLWVPETRSPEFAAEARRESEAVASSRTEADDQAFINAISVWNTEE